MTIWRLNRTIWIWLSVYNYLYTTICIGLSQNCANISRGINTRCISVFATAVLLIIIKVKSKHPLATRTRNHADPSAYWASSHHHHTVTRSNECPRFGFWLTMLGKVREVLSKNCWGLLVPHCYKPDDFLQPNEQHTRNKDFFCLQTKNFNYCHQSAEAQHTWLGMLTATDIKETWPQSVKLHVNIDDSVWRMNRSFSNTRNHLFTLQLPSAVITVEIIDHRRRVLLILSTCNIHITAHH